MAISATVAYTFSPNTTISSSQVNTNKSDEVGIWQGLEALTKTFSALKVDADPATALEVATKQYVDQYAVYRRPVLQYSSATVVNLETGLTGTSGQALIQFPDGSKRTDSTASRINFDITRNAVLSGTAQSGLRTGLSEATNTWYALYAVKVTDSSTNFVVVGDTRIPTQANFADINTSFGTNGWVYLGEIANGDNSGATGDILNFIQSGGVTILRNAVTCNSASSPMTGIRIATATAAATLTYTYASGTAIGSGQIPAHLPVVYYGYACDGQGTAYGLQVTEAAGAYYIEQLGGNTAVDFAGRIWMNATSGMKLIRNTGTPDYDVLVTGWIDGVLGVGANPLL